MKAKSFGQTFLGLAIVALGVGFLLDSLNIFDFGRVLSDWWPAIIVLVGLASLLSNPRQFMWPLIIVAVGTLLQLRELGVLDFNVWGLIWPAIIIFTGLSIMLDRLNPKTRETNDNQVDMFVAFSGQESKNRSQTFEGGKLTALFGGISLDLRKADIKDQATIDVFTAFGGLDIRVPEGWEVKASGLPLFGGWEDKTEKPSGKAPVLYVRGTCLFGGFEIKN